MSCEYYKDGGYPCGKTAAPGSDYCSKYHRCPGRGCESQKSSREDLCSYCVESEPAPSRSRKKQGAGITNASVRDDGSVTIRASGYPTIRFQDTTLNTWSPDGSGYDPDQDYAGFILYGILDRETDRLIGSLNGVGCSPGTIFLWDTSCGSVANCSSSEARSEGQVHGRVFHATFNCSVTAATEIDRGHFVIAEGFAVQNGQFRSRSGVFNGGRFETPYHDGTFEMHEKTMGLVERRVARWMDE